jgi:murein DD-endopeptidase MepM/ murein hydrolase activator NlpD
VPLQEYYIWPVSGEVCGEYAMDVLVWNPTMRDWRTHDGVDIAAALGTQVKAAGNGVVTEIYTDDLLGTTVVLTHTGGLVSRYANLAATPAVAVGDHVGVGEVLGAVGATALGESGDVCHLHFAMTRDGESVDPTAFLP